MLNACRYYDDVVMQCEAKKWADEFNKEGVPKRVDFLEAYLIQVMCRMSHVTRHTSHATSADRQTWSAIGSG